MFAEILNMSLRVQIPCNKCMLNNAIFDYQQFTFMMFLAWGNHGVETE